MSRRLFLGTDEVATVAADDRGLAYGESLFETMRAHRGELPWWPMHMARLAHGAQRLSLPLPPLSRMHEEARRLLGGDDALLKLQLTRGGGAHGYAGDPGAVPFWILSRHPLPLSPEVLDVVWCRTRLAAQPLLAGLKHGNRLEQVLAANEVRAAGADEGLMRDAAGRVIAATAANLFVRLDGHWQTPTLRECGVAGVMRGWLLEAGVAEEAELEPQQVEAAEAVFLCNAVRGILPVRRLGARSWPVVHPAVRELQQQLAQAHAGFAPTTERS
ncbi:aminodeoxychorismate lyase [Luteimonas sp. e5]